MTQKDLFTRQCDRICTAFNPQTVIMGDFNLDFNRRHDLNYQYYHLFELYDEKMSRFNLLQLVNTDTWFRTVGNINRSSLLDHIYVSNLSLVTNVVNDKPIFGDHEIVVADLNIIRPKPRISMMRDWRHYSKELLCENLFMFTVCQIMICDKDCDGA